MAFLWFFTIFWCAISFTMFGVTLKSGESIFAIAFTGVFVLLGLALLAFLLAQLYQRLRVGKTTLLASPALVQLGDTVTLTFQSGRTFDDSQTVHFTLITERYDGEDWIAISTAKGSATLHASLTSTSTRMVVPPPSVADTATAKLRARATACLGSWKLAITECPVSISVDDRPWTPSSLAAPLSVDTPAEATGEASPFPNVAAAESAPSGAQEITPGVWQWTLRSRIVQVVGAVLLVFSFFWWHNIGLSQLLRDVFSSQARSSHASRWALAEAGLMLFQVPFVVAGVFCTLLGLALLFGRIVAVVRPGEVSYRVRALGRTAYEQSVPASAIVALHPTPFYSSSTGSTATTSIASFALAARTADTVTWLPITAPSIAEIAERARWLASRLGVGHILFDPQPAGSTTLVARDANGEPALKRASPVGRLFLRAMGISTALALVGFAILFASVFMPHRAEHDLAHAGRAARPSPLIDAVRAKNVAEVNRLLDGGVNVNMQSLSVADDADNGRTPLHWAVLQNDAAMARTLLRRGADPHIAAYDGWSALATAIVRSDATFGAAFIEAEIDFNRPTPFPYSPWGDAPKPPLLIAIAHQRPEVVRALIRAGADPATPGPWGFPVGHFAAYFGFNDCLQALRDAGVDLNAPIAANRPHAGATYLMHAVHGGKQATVDFLLDAGGNLNARDALGKTAIDHAMDYKHVALANYLRSREQTTSSKILR